MIPYCKVLPSGFYVINLKIWDVPCTQLIVKKGHLKYFYDAFIVFLELIGLLSTWRLFRISSFVFHRERKKQAEGLEQHKGK